MRSFNPASASLIIRASNPAPAVRAKCSPFADPVSSARRSPCSPMSTASVRSTGISRLTAIRLAVPAGRIARTASGPASASMQRWTLPSPPQTNTTSAPCFTARRAALGTSLLFATSNQSGSAYPSCANTSRSSPRPPSRLFSACATTAIRVMPQPPCCQVPPPEPSRGADREPHDCQRSGPRHARIVRGASRRSLPMTIPLTDIAAARIVSPGAQAVGCMATVLLGTILGALLANSHSYPLRDQHHGRTGHHRKRPPAQDHRCWTVAILTHERAIRRDVHHEEQEGGGRDPVDHGDNYQ